MSAKFIFFPDDSAGGTELKFKVNVTADFTIPTDGTLTYLYDVDWGDTNTDTGETGDVLHTYASSGIYTITVTGTFPKFYFNNTGDKSLITEIVQWGDVGYSTTDQKSAFHGCNNLTTLASDIGWLNSVTQIQKMFQQCTNLTSLPSALTLEAVTNGNFAFLQTQNLGDGDNLTLTNITNMRGMFRLSGITLTTSGNMTLSNATDCRQAFDFAPFLSDIPSVMSLDSLTLGLAMFANVTLPTSSYSLLINNIDTNNSNTGVTFQISTSTNYDSSAEVAHDNLTGVKSWSITDGGLV